MKEKTTKDVTKIGGNIKTTKKEASNKLNFVPSGANAGYLAAPESIRVKSIYIQNE